MYNLRNINYYKSLDYNVIIEKQVLGEETWFIAYCKELGKFACYGQGGNQNEALESFYKEKDDFIDHLYKKKTPIPEPLEVNDDFLLSGIFNIRTSPQVHTRLSRQAKEQGLSLNQYVNIILTYGFAINDFYSEHENCLFRIEKKLNEHHAYMTEKFEYNKCRIVNLSSDRDDYKQALNYAAESESEYFTKKVVNG